MDEQKSRPLPDVLPTRLRLLIVVATAAGATVGFALGTFLALGVLGEPVADHMMRMALIAGGAVPLAVLAISVDVLIVQLLSPEPLPGAGLWTAMRHRWQGDRSEEEFARAFTVAAFCLGAVVIVTLLALLPIELFAGTIAALGVLWAANRVVTICRDANYLLVRSLVSALLQGALLGFILTFFIG